jgi:hypothetical protein
VKAEPVVISPGAALEEEESARAPITKRAASAAALDAPVERSASGRELDRRSSTASSKPGADGLSVRISEAPGLAPEELRRKRRILFAGLGVLGALLLLRVLVAVLMSTDTDAPSRVAGSKRDIAAASDAGTAEGRAPAPSAITTPPR